MTSRIAQAQELMSIHGVDALIVSPSPDLRYLSGYAALPLERLTALIVRAEDDPVLMVPELEVAAARAAGVSFEITSWAETEDPFALIATLLSDADVIGVDDRMWASRLFAIQEALPETSLTVGGSIIAELRMTKEPEEVAALTDAGAAIDRVHDRMHEWLRAGRTEREVGADIQTELHHITACLIGSFRLVILWWLTSVAPTKLVTVPTRHVTMWPAPRSILSTLPSMQYC